MQRSSAFALLRSLTAKSLIRTQQIGPYKQNARYRRGGKFEKTARIWYL